MADLKFRVGCQSWGYDDWVTPVGSETVFYPRGTKRGDMLGLYSRVFDTIEVDATLYGIPPDSTLMNWYDETSPGFVFSLKFPREVTHEHALRGPSVQISAEFVERASILRDKLGLFLIQFPARFEATAENQLSLGHFLDKLPQDHRFAVEFRNTSWFTERTMKTLENAGVSLCLVEGKWMAREIMFKWADRVPSSYRYVRIMGERDLLRFDRVYRHRDEILERWRSEMARVKATDVFIYSDNYFEGFAPATANKMLSLVGLPEGDPAKLESQGTLF
jgi:uncharacterized protein YecE (DUF72 family)